MKYHYDQFNQNQYESHRLALSMVKPDSKVLDIGCATGYFAKELSKQDCETWGVDQDKMALKKASQYCKKVFATNLDDMKPLPFPEKYFDYVLLLDVIEHLTHPEILMEEIKKYLKPGGRIVVSVPNIAHASIRWMLLLGNFQYSETGILDRTHVHFYTQKGILDAIKKFGFKVLRLSPTNGMCKVPLLYKITDRLPTSWQYKIARKFPSLFSFQFVVLAKVR